MSPSEVRPPPPGAAVCGGAAVRMLAHGTGAPAVVKPTSPHAWGWLPCV